MSYEKVALGANISSFSHPSFGNIIIITTKPQREEVPFSFIYCFIWFALQQLQCVKHNAGAHCLQIMMPTTLLLVGGKPGKKKGRGSKSIIGDKIPYMDRSPDFIK